MLYLVETFFVNTYITLKQKRFIKSDLENKIVQELPRYIAIKVKPHLLIHSNYTVIFHKDTSLVIS